MKIFVGKYLEKELWLETLYKIGITNYPETTWTICLQECLRIAETLTKYDEFEFLRQRRFINIQSEWTKYFVVQINPIMWPIWYEYIFERGQSPRMGLRFGRGFMGRDWLAFPGERVVLSWDPLSELAEFWEIEGSCPSQLQFRLEANTILVRQLILEKLLQMGVPKFQTPQFGFSFRGENPLNPSSYFLRCVGEEPIIKGTRLTSFSSLSCSQQFCIIVQRFKELEKFLLNLKVSITEP